VWCNGNIVGLGPIDAGSSPATLKKNWDVAKSGKALDFGSNIHGFKSHRPKKYSRVSLMVKYPAFNR
jgi:hypothetical protein